MMFKSLLVLLTLLYGLNPQVVYAIEVDRLALAHTHAIVVTVDLNHDQLQLYLADSSRNVYQSFQAINKDLARNQQQLIFAMNAGMFHPSYLPVGLYIERGVTYFPLNQQHGWGNFFMQPNGVFFKHPKQGFKILSTTDYANRRFKHVSLATQSGPLLVYQGKINPLFKPDSESRVIRNAVAVLTNQQAKFVITEQPVNFYELADFFKNTLGVQDALYLDGTISSVYLPALKRHDRHRLLGPIIAVVKKTAK